MISSDPLLEYFTYIILALFGTFIIFTPKWTFSFSTQRKRDLQLSINYLNLSKEIVFDVAFRKDLDPKLGDRFWEVAERYRRLAERLTETPGLAHREIELLKPRNEWPDEAVPGGPTGWKLPSKVPGCPPIYLFPPKGMKKRCK